MTKDLFYLTRQILRFRLERQPDEGEEAALVHAFLVYGSIYVVADPATSEEEWASKTFGISTQGQAVRLYLDRDDAAGYAKEIGALRKDGAPMVVKAAEAMAGSLIESYTRKGYISHVWLCGKTPVKAKVGVSHFAGGAKKDKASTITDPDKALDEEPALGTAPAAPQAQPAPSAEAPVPLELVEEVRKVLSEPSRAERRKLDPSGNYLNLHYLVEKLIFANRIPAEEMDERLGLVHGFTKSFIADKTSDTVPLEIAKKYLRYFGLYEFLFLFRADCKELRDMLKSSPQLDTYEVKPARGHHEGDEIFILEKVEKTQTSDGANVYRLTFRSPDREKPVQVVSSTNLDMNPGGKYMLPRLMPVRRMSTTAPVRDAATGRAEDAPSDEEAKEVLAKLEEQAAKGKQGGSSWAGGEKALAKVARNQDMTPAERQEADRKTVLEWIIKHKKVGAKEAQAEMSKFKDDPEVMACFAKFATSGGKAASNFARRGYNLTRLTRNLHYTPIEAFNILADLREKPKEMLQMLKYRETDPQYQTKKTPQKD